jgi:hypothetical protein
MERNLLPYLTLPTHDPAQCSDPHDCLVESLTQRAEWTALSRQIVREHRRGSRTVQLATVCS